MGNDMSLAPVVMFVYNRADHFIKTYEALSKCKEAADTRLFIFSDGAKNDSAVNQVKEVRDAIREKLERKVFLSVNVVESPKNRGLAASIIAGVTEVIEKYGKVIVIEDDCVTSPYFLSFMNRCLDFYEEKDRVGAIAGYVPELRFPKDYKDDIFMAYRSCSCAWATWKNRWEGIDWELRNVSDFYRNPQLIKKLNSNGIDRFIRLYRQTKGNGSSWSVRFGAHLVKRNQYTVYPKYSYIRNIGCDESGVHSKSEDAIKMSVDLSKAIENPELKMVDVNKKLQKIMKKHYSGGLWSDIKRGLATKLIIVRERMKL